MALSVGDAYISLNVDAAGLTSAIQKGEQSVQKFGTTTEKTVDGLGGKFKSLGSMITGVFEGIGIGVAQKGIESLGSAFGALKSSVIDYNATLQDSKTSWAVLLGGADAAQKKLDELAKFAAVTPFEFPEVTKAAQIMQTFGGDLLDTSQNLTLVGNIAAGVGQPFTEVATWTSRMYDAFQSGKPFGEAAQRLQEMGAMSGATRDKLEQMQATGATGAELWATFNSEMQRFNQNGGMMAQMANTWNGRLGTLHDTLNGLAATAGKPIFDNLSTGLGHLVDMLSTDKATAFATAIGGKVGGAIDTVFGKIGQGVTVGRELWDMITKVEGAGSKLFDAFQTGDFNQAFGPILAAIDSVFGEKARDKYVLPVSHVLSDIQLIRDAFLTIGQAWSGQWQDSDKISSPFVRAVGNITQVFHDARVTAAQAWAGDWVDSDKISNPFVRAVGNIGQLFHDARVTASQAFSGNWADSDKISNPFIRGVGIVATEFGKLPDQLSGIWSKITDQVGPALAPVGTAIQQAIGGFQTGGVQGGAINLATMILGPDAGAGVQAALDNIQDKLTPVISAIEGFNYSGFFGTMATDVGNFATQMAPLATSVQNLYLALSPTGAILSTITGQFNVWTSLAQTLGPILENTLGAAFIGISGALGPIGDQFARLGAVAATQGPQLEAIGNSLMQLWTALTPVFQAVGAVIGGVLVFALGELMSVIGGLIGAVSGALPGALKMMQGAFDTMTGVINFLVDAFKGAVQIIGDLIHGDWSQAFADMIALGTKLQGDITQIFNGLKEGVIGAIQAMIGGVTGYLDGFVSTFVGFFGSIFTQITGDKLPAFVTGFTDGIHNLATDTLNTIEGWVGDIGTKIGNGLSNVTTTLDSWSSDISKKLDQWASDIGTLLLSPFKAAGDAIGGILGGFKTAMLAPLQAAMNSLGNFGSGVAGVINWIAGALHLSISIGTPPIPQLAKGTSDFQGGPAIVGEKGPELVYMPKHAIVIPNKMSDALLKSGLVPGFAGGLNLPNLGDLIKGGPEWLLQQAINAIGIPIPNLPGALAGGGKALFDQVKQWLTDAVVGFVNTALPVSPKNIKAMQDFVAAHVGEPYTWGGGHGAPGFDCSGWVAAVLDAGGIPNPHSIVTGFYEWMQGGRTGVVDIGVNDPYAAPDVQHTGIGVMGQWSEAGGRAGGVGYTDDYFSNVGHPPSLDVKGKAPSGDLSNVDWVQSAKNMGLGVAGQWTKFGTGGIITETIVGQGIKSGRGYVIGEDGNEAIIPLGDGNTVKATTQPDQLGPARPATGGTLGSLITTELGRLGDRIVAAIETLKGLGGATSFSPTTGSGTPAATVPATTGGTPSSANDPTSPDYTGAPGTGAFDDELLHMPGDNPKPEWDKRRKILGIPTSAEYKASKNVPAFTQTSTPKIAQSTATKPATTGMIGHFPEPVMPDPGHPGQWVGVNTSTVYGADGKPVGGMTTALGMVGHFPERVLPDPGHPGQWVGVQTGTVYGADGTVVSSPTNSLPGGPVAVTPSGALGSVGSKMSLTLSAPPDIRAPLALPGQTGMIGHFPEPVLPHPGKPGKWVGVNTGTVYNADGSTEDTLSLGLPGPATLLPPAAPAPTKSAAPPIGMIGHFPEPVLPHPGHPGWWVGANTGTVYDADGNPVRTTGIPAPSGPSTATPAAPATATPAATPTTGPTKGGPIATLVVETHDTFDMPDGTSIVRVITSNEIALESLTEGVTGIQAREKSRIKDNRAGAGTGAIKRLS